MQTEPLDTEKLEKLYHTLVQEYELSAPIQFVTVRLPRHWENQIDVERLPFLKLRFDTDRTVELDLDYEETHLTICKMEIPMVE